MNDYRVRCFRCNKLVKDGEPVLAAHQGNLLRCIHLGCATKELKESIKEKHG